MQIQENDYVIVLSNNVQGLATAVSDLQKKGYVCVGGLVQQDVQLKQAMVLPAECAPIQNYVLVTGSDPDELQKEVVQMLAAGWRLHDGPTSYTTEIQYDRDSTMKSYGITQAMVK
jgi:hypothetical protein